MHPVEERSSAVVGVAARQGDQRLHEAQPRANDAQKRVRVLGDRDLRPALWWGEKRLILFEDNPFVEDSSTNLEFNLEFCI